MLPAAQVRRADGRIAQITGTGGGTIGYDLNGNLTSDGQATPTNYVYDAENRLVSTSGAKTATLTYDPMGRLYQVTDAAGTQRFLYDGDRLILEYNGSGVVQRRFAHGAGVDEPLVWYEGSTVSSANRRYMHADHQGSIINVTNAAGSTLIVGAYDAYGVTATNTGRFQYTGQTAITQVGLYYYKARFYNPALGRFMQTDPIGYDDDVNLYAYVGNDPLNNTDPTGLSTDCTGTRAGAGCDFVQGSESRNAIFNRATVATVAAKAISGKVQDIVQPARGSAVLPDPNSPLGKIREAFIRATQEVETNIPFLRGIFIHTRFAQYVRALGPGYAAEVSYRYGNVERYGLLGTVRTDAQYGPISAPKFVVEVKTGGATMSRAEAQNYRDHLPQGTPLYLMHETVLE